jgi:hypothetical protein
MPAAIIGPRLGDDAKMYYSATLGGAGALTEVDCVIDDEISSERRSAESNVRGDAEVRTILGKLKNSITANLQVRVGSPGVNYLVLKNAYFANTVLHFALCTGDILLSGNQTFRMEGQISKWTESRPDGDTVKVAIEIVPAAIGTVYNSTVAVTA